MNIFFKSLTKKKINLTLNWLYNIYILKILIKLIFINKKITSSNDKRCLKIPISIPFPYTLKN